MCIPIHIKNIYCLLFILSWDRILGHNPGKSLKSLPLYYSQSPPQLCLEISISSNSRNFLQFLQFSYCTLWRREAENLKIKPFSLPYGLKDPYKNLKSEHSLDYAQKPQRNCTFMNSASVRYLYLDIRWGIVTCKAHVFNQDTWKSNDSISCKICSLDLAAEWFCSKA